MSPKLRNLLVIIGTVSFAGGVVTLWRPADDSNVADLLDAGLVADGTPRIVSCPVRLGPGGRAWLADAGVDAGTVPYAQLEVVAVTQPGANVVFAGLPEVLRQRALSLVDTDKCTARACATDVPFCQARKPRLVAPPCVKRPVGTPADQCLRLVAALGATIDFGDGNVFIASEAVGSGCVPAVCVVSDPTEDP